MKLFYNGTDIYNDVSLNYCVHEMYAEKQADTLVLRFNDTKGIWSKWNPADGDVLRFTEGASDTGKMFLHSMKPENGLFTIRAMAMPKSGATRKSKSWAGVRFLQLGNEIAANHGLTFQNYGCTDQVYPYLKQESETDFALFSRLCTLEGCQMLIYDGKLLAYSEQYIEQQAVAGTLEVDETPQFAAGKPSRTGIAVQQSHYAHQHKILHHIHRSRLHRTGGTHSVIFLFRHDNSRQRDHDKAYKEDDPCHMQHCLSGINIGNPVLPGIEMIALVPHGQPIMAILPKHISKKQTR